MERSSLAQNVLFLHAVNQLSDNLRLDANTKKYLESMQERCWVDAVKTHQDAGIVDQHVQRPAAALVLRGKSLHTLQAGDVAHPQVYILVACK